MNVNVHEREKEQFLSDINPIESIRDVQTHGPSIFHPNNECANKTGQIIGLTNFQFFLCQGRLILKMTSELRRVNRSQFQLN